MLKTRKVRKMTHQKGINRDSYKYISSLLAQLLELDIDTEEKITGYIENYGLDHFLLDSKHMDLPQEISEKIESLTEIIESLEIPSIS